MVFCYWVVQFFFVYFGYEPLLEYFCPLFLMRSQGHLSCFSLYMGFPCGSAGKESACNVRDLGSVPELGRSPGEGNGYPLQYSGLENSMDCVAHEVTKSWTQLSLSLLYVKHLFPLVTFKFFSLSLIFSNLTKMCLGEIFFVFVLFGVYWASWICNCISFTLREFWLFLNSFSSVL